MFHKEQGFKHGFFTALNRCVTTSFFTAPLEAKQNEKKQLILKIAPGITKNIARERYLAIPTFIRQGKTLGL